MTLDGPMRKSMMARLEDRRMVTGAGRYLADYVDPDTLLAGFARAEQASARIMSLNTDTAANMPGVRAVFTADDLAEGGVKPFDHVALPRDDGEEPTVHPMPVLCSDIVRHVGEPIAMVVAETPGQLADALETVEIELVDAEPVKGIGFLRRFGQQNATADALAAATHRHRVTLDIPRVTAFALEPRCAIAHGDAAGNLHYRMSTQDPFAVRAQMVAHFGWDPQSIRVVAGDVGGSFGLKSYMTREDAALAWAARQLNEKIAWLPSRMETIISDAQGRGVSGSVEIGLDDALSILAVQARFDIDVGAYPDRRAFGLMNNVNGLTGMYRVPNIHVEITGQLSPRAPLAPFRGNGRPEATQAIEKALDVAARHIGADPADLRLQNLIGPTEMPATTGLGTVLDSGDFPRVMQAALDLNAGAEARRSASEARGKLYGVGLANCIESAGGPVRQPRPDFARLTLSGDGNVTLAPGVMSVGQGHETGLAAMVADRLQIDLSRIRYQNGDTDALSNGRGSGGSAGLTVAGSAVWMAIDDFIAEGRHRTAEVLGCNVDEITYRDGAFHRSGTNENLSLEQLATTAGGIDTETRFTPTAATFPNGTHICEVEIDTDSGETQVMRYVAVEDVGRVLNPILVEGQLQGGIAQGLSLGLGERLVFDKAHQILTGSLMDYGLIRADNLPMISTANVEVPTSLNPLGVKGVGEAGTVGATAALASAVSDALWRAGVKEFDLPATPFRVWQALRER